MKYNSHVQKYLKFINWLYKYNLVEYLYKALVLDTIYDLGRVIL